MWERCTVASIGSGIRHVNPHAIEGSSEGAAAVVSPHDLLLKDKAQPSVQKDQLAMKVAREVTVELLTQAHETEMLTRATIPVQQSLPADPFAVMAGPYP